MEIKAISTTAVCLYVIGKQYCYVIGENSVNTNRNVFLGVGVFCIS